MASAAEIQRTTKDVIAEFCSYGLLFTALDVSNEVKDRVTGVRHREVAPIVRALFEDDEMAPGYTRTLIDVTIPGGKTVQAFLYHDSSRDTADYGQGLRAQRAAAPTPGAGGSSAPSTSPSKPAPKPTPSAPPPAPAPAIVIDDSATSITLSVLSDGTAVIPRVFVERAGIGTDEVALDTAGLGSALVLSELDEDRDEDEEPLEVLEYEAGDLLRIPASYLSAFSSGARIEARIEIGTIHIEG